MLEASVLERIVYLMQSIGIILLKACKEAGALKDLDRIAILERCRNFWICENEGIVAMVFQYMP